MKGVDLGEIELPRSYHEAITSFGSGTFTFRVLAKIPRS